MKRRVYLLLYLETCVFFVKHFGNCVVENRAFTAYKILFTSNNCRFYVLCR